VSTVWLREIAHARGGDKGDTANLAVIAYDPRDYPLLLAQVTAARVKAHFGGLVRGQVERFELPGLAALNFVLHGALDGGVSRSPRVDQYGKALSSLLLSLEIELPSGHRAG
jgi:hypothetical protein